MNKKTIFTVGVVTLLLVSADIGITFASKIQSAEPKVSETIKKRDNTHKKPTTKETKNTKQAKKVNTPQEQVETQESSQQSEKVVTPQTTTEQPINTEPVIPSTGITINGQNFPIGYFSGSGAVPADNTIYEWSSIPNYYLVERMGGAGSVIWQLGVGSVVYVNGREYHVTAIDNHISRSNSALARQRMAEHAIGFQTCESSGADTLLTMWYAD